MHRLTQVIVHAHGKTAFGLALEYIGRDSDDRYAGLAGLQRADSDGQLVAIHHRHVQIGHQDAVIAALPARECLAAVVGDVGSVPEQRE